MARATDADVEAVIEVDADISLTPFITVANELVTELCTDSDYTDERLVIIETWLAAHCYSVRDKAIAQERASSVQVQYQTKIGMFLAETTHGQMAMTIDSAGNLAALSKRMEDGEPATIQFSWMGTDYDTDEDD